MDLGSSAAVGGWSAAPLNFLHPEGILRGFLLAIYFICFFIYFPVYNIDRGDGKAHNFSFFFIIRCVLLIC